MYKIFSGEKCIVISNNKQFQSLASDDEKERKWISFQSSEKLIAEYRDFKHSAYIKELLITGDEKEIWKVFCSLFFYIESAGGAVMNENDELLMIFRNDYWDLPKGKIDDKETPMQTALREVQEECGIMNLTIVEELPYTHHIYLRDEKEYLKRTYWFKMICKDSPKLVPQTSEGITQAKWVSRGEIKKILPFVYPSLREILHALG
jgi:8-oxo-dGTP pyrophosphatase MutT (NUDIX family)